MRFTASSKFNSIARGAAKYIQWKVYAKKTSSLSEALTYGTWIDCTGRVNDLPPIRSGVEYQLGQFKADNLQLSCSDIDWWEANVLNTSAGQVIEMKVEAQVGLSETDLATDIVYAFSGLVDPLSVNFNELDDTLTLSAYTADELANRMSGESLSTRYIFSNVDGAGTNGLILPAIPGVYVTDANISTYVLKPGLHTISYRYDGGIHKLKLDNGYEVSLTPFAPGFWTLGDSPGITPPDEQRVVVYIDGVNLTTVTSADDVIVQTAGDTLPYTWFDSIHSRTFLSECFTQIGLVNQTFDTESIASYDGLRYLSYLDIPPNDPDETGQFRAMAATPDGTLYIGIGAKLFVRDSASQAYTLIATMAASVDKLIYDVTNGQLWIFYSGSTKVKVYVIGSSTMSAEHSLSATPGGDGIDYCADSGTILYVTTANTIRELSYEAPTFTDSQLFTAAGLTPAYSALAGWARMGNSNRLYFSGTTSAVLTIHYITWNGSAWVEGADFCTLNDAIATGAFNAAEAKIYYWNNADGKIWSVSTSAEVAITGINYAEVSIASVPTFYYDAQTEAIYAITDGGYLYRLEDDVATLIVTNIAADSYLLTTSTAALFGLTPGRRLWQYSTSLALYLSRPDCEGITIKAALNKVCQAFNLMFQISSIKAAYVYRRGSDDGTPQTSGNNLTVNTDLAENLSKENLYGKAFDLISIDNGTEKHTYDGTTGPVVFDKGVFGDKRILEITNDWIPTELIKHLLYRMWQFFKTDRSLYRIPLGIVPLFQYEILDKVTASFTTSKIAVSGWGPIMNQTLYPDGSMDLEVLI